MYKVIYYQDPKGHVPILEFLDQLTVKVQVKVRKQITLLSQEGPNLKRPYADYLESGIYELRIKFSPNEYRILYFFIKKTDIILTHGFMKKTNKVPSREISKAISYKLDFERSAKDIV